MELRVFRVAAFYFDESLAVLVIIAVCVALPLIGLVLTDHWMERFHRRNYLRMQASRASLSDEAFCRRSGLAASLVSLVFSIRSKVASFDGYDPLRVYPEDSISHHLHLHHEHHVAMVVEDMNIRGGYDNDSFPNEVDTVADFVRVVWRLKKEADDAANGRQEQGGATFRLAFGRCSCAEPQPDAVRQALCRDLVKRLDVLRGMDTGELLRLPRYSRAVARIEGRSVRFETIRDR